MGRLIDGNEAIDAIWKTDPLTYAGCIDAINALDEKIIRCKDCRWRKDPRGFSEWLPCKLLIPPDDFFCKWAERKPKDEKKEQIIEKRNKGHWILSDYQVKEDTDNGNYRYYCSNCSHADIHARTVDVPYCWYCGAKMEEGN